MRKAVIITWLVPVLLLCGFVALFMADKYLAANNRIVDSLGEYQSEERFTSGGFLNYTDYEKYTYSDVDFSENEYFDRIKFASKKKLLTYTETFEAWIKSIEKDDPENEIVIGYDFDTALISEEDYIYISNDSDDYASGLSDVYFFDMETMTLYHFRNNM